MLFLNSSMLRIWGSLSRLPRFWLALRLVLGTILIWWSWCSLVLSIVLGMG
ncbi:hypothetical protein Hanom_Chr06g00533271 [Helianthus anomalus]